MLRELQKNTSKEHHDYNAIEQALELVIEVAGEINSSIKHNEKTQQIIAVQKQFSGNIEFVEPGRVFVKDGQMSVMTGKGMKSFHIFLFDDLLVLAKKPNMFSGYNIIDQIFLSPLSCEVIDHTDKSFELEAESSNIVFTVDSVKSKEEWVAVLEKCLEVLSMPKRF